MIYLRKIYLKAINYVVKPHFSYPLYPVSVWKARPQVRNIFIAPRGWDLKLYPPQEDSSAPGGLRIFLSNLS